MGVFFLNKLFEFDLIIFFGQSERKIMVGRLWWVFVFFNAVKEETGNIPVFGGHYKDKNVIRVESQVLLVYDIIVY